MGYTDKCHEVAKSSIRNYSVDACVNAVNLIEKMSVWRVILSVLFPPLAVYDKGCGSIMIVFILTIAGWVPGVIAALVILNNPKFQKAANDAV